MGSGKARIPWNKGLTGLKRIGVPHTEETKNRLREINLGKKMSEETKKKISLSNLGKKHTQESIDKIKTTKSKNPFHWSTQDRERIGRQSKSRAEETREKRSSSMMGKKHSSETKKIMSKNLSELWKNKEFREKRLMAIGIGNNLKPNNPEKIILNILNELYPNEWKYTGDYSLIINGKNPDFANINGQKKLIELFGDYWHRGQNPQDRIDIFKVYGYDTLIIWECELKNKVKVELKIQHFIKGTCPKQAEGEDGYMEVET